MVAARTRAGRHEGRQEIVALVCAQAVTAEFAAFRAAASCRGARLEVRLLPCTSKLEAGDLLAVLDRGADAVLVVGCRQPACRFQVGSARAARRVAHAQRMLEEIGIGGWRLRIELGGKRSEAEVVALVEDYAQDIAGQPTNPVRTLER